MRRAHLFVFLPLLSVCASGQVFDFQAERVPVSELRGLCRFHTSDDIRWSQPGFDDSGWPLVHCDQPWSSQGYQAYTGVSWYRFVVKIPAVHQPLAVAIPEIGDSWQLFADGVEIGHYGSLPPHPGINWGFSWVTMNIPESVASRGQAIQFGIRVWRDPNWVSFNDPGPTKPMLVGDATSLKRQEELRYRESFWEMTAWSILLLCYLLSALAGLGFFLLRRKEIEYLWFALAEIGWAGLCIFNMVPLFGQLPWQAYELELGISLVVIGTCWPTFLVTFLKVPKGKLYWVAITAGVLCGLVFVPLLFEWVSPRTWIVPYYSTFMAQALFAVMLILLPARRGVFDARLLLVPEILDIFQRFAGGIYYLAVAGGRPELASMLDRWTNTSFLWPFPLGLQTITYLLAQSAVIAILVLRFARSRRDEERMTGEMEAAHQVQQVLIPQEIPSVPGFRIAAAYQPAGEVGGDFFQVIPIERGGVLVVVGDVSGKGLPAAMTVSLLVGTFRTLAHYTQSPGEILAAMNRRMLARSKGGFTTCLVLRLDLNSTFTVANAGHLSPYRNGEEVPIEGGLPLGLHAESTYVEAKFELAFGAQLTLFTDGVVEARSNTGELFGFPRAERLSCNSAEQILDAARAFGQEDDITVVTLGLADGIAAMT